MMPIAGSFLVDDRDLAWVEEDHKRTKKNTNLGPTPSSFLLGEQR